MNKTSIAICAVSATILGLAACSPPPAHSGCCLDCHCVGYGGHVSPDVNRTTAVHQAAPTPDATPAQAPFSDRR